MDRSPNARSFPPTEIDPFDSADASSESSANAGRARLNTWVAITVALLATFMGICKVKDDNIVQSMQQAQADKIDNWSFYQARNIRQEVAQAELSQLGLMQSAASGASTAQRTALDSAVAMVAHETG